MVEMAAPTWAGAKARAGSHPACVHANVHVGAALGSGVATPGPTRVKFALARVNLLWPM